MFVHPAQGVPQGEAGFVENLVVLNGEKSNLAYKYEGMGEWKVSGKKTPSFSFSYTVRLDHDQHAWFEAGGMDEVFYATAEGFFSTGYAMFLFPAVENLQPIQDVTVMKHLEKMYARYVTGKLIQCVEASLQQSGVRKQEQRSLVYGGGAMFALALDIEMRQGFVGAFCHVRARSGAC